MKKIAIFSLVATILFWVIMSTADYIYEVSIRGLSDFEAVVYLLFTYMTWIFAIVAYIIFMKKSGQRDKSIKLKLLDKLIWIVINVVIYIPIFDAVNYNRWIVPQVSGALDGIEYMVAGVIFGVCSLIGFWIYDVVVFVKNKRNSSDKK